MRIARLRHQADRDRNLVEVGLRQAGSAQAAADAQYVLLADREGDIDRVELDNAGEFGGAAEPDQAADSDLMRRYHAVERCGHLGIAEVDRCQGHPGLLVLHIRLVGVALGQCLVDGRSGREVAAAERRLTVVFRVGLRGLRLGGGQHRLRLLQLRLVWRWLNHEKRVAPMHRGAILAADLLQEAIDAGDQVYLIVRHSVAGRFQIGRHGLTQRLRDFDMR